jgi:Tfp pilus assembly protein PilN
MPAKTVSVNLLEKDQSESPIGRIITWATTYGRYIMITTEIVVLLAFISRFSLDRKLTDLNEAIAQKQAIIQANQPFENDVKKIQSQLATIKSLTTTQGKLVDMLILLKSLMPPDVYMNTIAISADHISADVNAGSTDGFGMFLENLQQTQQFVSVDIASIKKQPQTGIRFQLSITLSAPAKSRSAASAAKY